MRAGRIRMTSSGWIVAIAICAATAGPVGAQPTLKDMLATGGDEASGAEETADAAQDPAGRDTPRGTVRSFLEAVNERRYEDAARYFEAPRGGEVEGAALARQIEVIFDQTLWFDLGLLSDAPEGRTGDGLPANRENVGSVPSQQGDVPVILQRVTEEGRRVWKFASSFVARVPALYEEHGYGPLGRYLPDVFFEIRVLEVQLWQWIGLLILVVAVTFLAWALTSVGVALIGRTLRRSRGDLAERAIAVASGPLRLALAVFLFSGGKYLLNLAIPVNVVFGTAESAVLIVAFTWALLRLTDVASSLVDTKLRERQQGTAMTLVPPARKTVKLFVLVFAVIAAFDSFGFDVTAVLAGLGIGGIAVALAAQKSVENLFGGFTLYADRPVRVGDFCRFGDRVGTVEEIGLRSTRVRTLDRTLVSVPNAEFANLFLENFSRRDRIWYNPRIGLRYETTPDQIRYILVEIRKLLYAHPKVNSEPARIRFTNFGAYSLDLDIFAYVDVTDYGEYLEVAEDLNLRIMDIVEQAGSSFAFPSQTTYLEQGEGLDAERAGQAEQEVARWREEQTLYLPRFPAEKIQELAGALDFPPQGSPDARGKGEPA